MKFTLLKLLDFGLFILWIPLAFGKDPVVTDIFVPHDCPRHAKQSDHLLIEYRVLYNNNVIGAHYEAPGQLFHILLDQSDKLPIHKGIKGMCLNATRQLIWESGSNLDLNPLIPTDAISDLEEEISVTIRLFDITEQEDYEVINALKQDNISLVLDLISAQKGINAVDEWGYTTLMLAVKRSDLTIIAALLNARMPKVEVNAAKSSGFTALFYAVELKAITIMKALLRRGADPNKKLLQEGATGNTPLHYACLFEKAEHAQMLLEFGADPRVINEYGMTPLQLVPRDAVMSNKLYFKKIFEDALAKLKTSSSTNTVTNTPPQSDL